MPETRPSASPTGYVMPFVRELPRHEATREAPPPTRRDLRATRPRPRVPAELPSRCRRRRWRAPRLGRGAARAPARRAALGLLLADRPQAGDRQRAGDVELPDVVERQATARPVPVPHAVAEAEDRACEQARI